MADKKISELNSATTPLAGTEIIPIVQGGETKKVAVSEFGGSSNTLFYKLLVDGTPYLNTSSETYVGSILIPANTAENDAKLNINVAFTSDKVASSTLFLRAYRSSSAGSKTDLILTHNMTGGGKTGVEQRNMAIISDNIRHLNGGTGSDTDVGQSSSLLFSTAIDLSVDNYIDFTLQDSNTSNTASLIWAEVEIKK